MAYQPRVVDRELQMRLEASGAVVIEGPEGVRKDGDRLAESHAAKCSSTSMPTRGLPPPSHRTSCLRRGTAPHRRVADGAHDLESHPSCHR